MILYKIKRKITRLISKIDENLRLIISENDLLSCIYNCTVLKIRQKLFVPPVRMFGGGSFDECYQKAMRIFVKENLSPKESEALRIDIINCYLLYNIAPDEYFLYGFKGMKHIERYAFLSDIDRWNYCMASMSGTVFSQLRDKAKFYDLTSKYFGREVCLIQDKNDYEKFVSFLNTHKKGFLKPVKGTYGAGALIIDGSSLSDFHQTFDELLKKDTWILEELIIQHPKMAELCGTCVNTVRIPSIRTKEGIEILQPFLRAGRLGSIVDNAGAGGILAVFDQQTGVVLTDGYSKHGEVFVKHPDTDIVFKGWQIPAFDELLSLVKDIHLSLPIEHKYVGFDFAYTEIGWLLIEGNWGQFVGQYAEQKGVRKNFRKLLGL